MLRRKTLLFLTILLVVAAGFGAPKVMAFSDYNEEPLETLTINGWTVELISNDELSEGIFDWYYEISNSNGSASGLNFAAMLIPDCENGPKIVVDDNDLTDYFPPGVGEPSLDFGIYNEQAFVVKRTADKQTDWHLVTNTNVKTSSTILLKIRKIGAVPFEMAVPGCGLSEVGEETPEEIFESSEEFTYVNAAGDTYKVTVTKDQFGNILSVILTDPDGNETPGQGIPVGQIRARFPSDNQLGRIIEESFNYVPDGTVTKSGENSTCGYWYAGMFWNFCYY